MENKQKIGVLLSSVMTKLSDLYLIHRYFLQSKYSAVEKIKQIIRSYYAVLTNKGRFTYLGKDMYTGSRFDPIVMLTYPTEISFLKSFIKERELETVVDVGANIGQFACTTKFFFPMAHIYSFEPLPQTFNVLKKNAEGISGWSVFNYAIGDAKDNYLYLSKHGSAEHSLVESDDSMEKIRVRTTALNDTLVPKRVGLLKIDVEGYELEVIRNTKNLDVRYLLIEIDMKNSKEDLAKIKKAITKYWNRHSSLVCIQSLHQDAVKADALLKIDQRI